MISIIIPVYNEEEIIGAALARLKQLPDDVRFEIIVSDGSSTDNTVRIARNYARVIQCGKGRHVQCNGAAAHANGDILFFMHADMEIPSGALSEIEKKIYIDNYDGGGFSNRFSRYNHRIKTWGRILNLRFVDNDHRNNLVFFGDNGIFCRKCVFEALGGFKVIPIMEDYDFSRRLRLKYKSVRISKPKLVVSPRRHLKDGFIKTRLLWIIIKRLYQLGIPPEKLAKLYNDIR